MSLSEEYAEYLEERNALIEQGADEKSLEELAYSRIMSGAFGE